MKVATFNINSINARLDNLLKWLSLNRPDIMFLQEIKTEFNNFPFFEVQSAGYEVKVLGQKSYNGVAILSKHKLSLRQENLPEFVDEQARYIEAETFINSQKYVLVSLYLPNGNPPYNNQSDTSRFQYKLKFMDALIDHLENLRQNEKNVIIGGDFNVILSSDDVYNPELFKGNALFMPEVQERMRYILRSGYTDTWRTLFGQDKGYTFWDYTGAAFLNDLGMRIDYILNSPNMTDHLQTCYIDKDFRRQEKASDHTIFWAEYRD